MDFTPTQEQRQIRDMVAEFVDEEVVPRAAEIDETDEFPADLVAEMGELGLMGMPIPEEYGGAGLDYHAYAMALEEISRGSGGLGTIVAAHISLACNMIYDFGSEEQKEEYLPPVAAGDAVMGAAISEPDVGSDVSSVSTRAEKDGDEWVINGNKMWITNGSVGDYFVVLCKTDPDADGRYNGFSQILIESDREGFTAEKITGKLGIRASDTAELIFDDVRVPEENLVGTRGAGFLQLMQFFDETRTAVAAQGGGIAKGESERPLASALER
jgi:alkylation response protein AidB-like acyl-CoA dehydrogenase